MKNILLLGAGSYIGTSFQTYVEKKYSGEIACSTTSLRGEEWKKEDWSSYDCVINVTGKAHADIGNMTEDNKQEYYEINCALAHRAAEKAVKERVGQYVYLSSIIVYGDSSGSRKPAVITKDTKPAPSNFYGDSKWQAEQKLQKLFAHSADTGEARTNLAIVRPPMVYGRGCKGNYRTLEKMAEKLPVFPDYHNKRSMIYIGNLCEFLCCLAKTGEGGLYFPQNAEYVKTAKLVALLGEAGKSPVRLLRCLAPAVSLGKRLPGKPGGMVRKAFGSLVYEKSMSSHWDGAYQRYTLEESVIAGKV